jgi:hypothetical protein
VGRLQLQSRYPAVAVDRDKLAAVDVRRVAECRRLSAVDQGADDVVSGAEGAVVVVTTGVLRVTGALVPGVEVVDVTGAWVGSPPPLWVTSAVMPTAARAMIKTISTTIQPWTAWCRCGCGC